MLLIPRYGINGAAISTAISSLLYTLIKLALIYKKFKFQPYDINTLKTMGIIAICLALNFVLPTLESPLINILLRSASLGGTYLLLTYWLKIVPEFHHYLPWRK